MGFTVRVDDHTEEVLKQLGETAKVALEECGLAAEGYSKRLCAVDTGLLRNSITHALDGESPAISDYVDDNGEQRGQYNGTAPAESGKSRAVYLGTNVEYAPYVELGTSRTGAQPFIKPALANHVSSYQRIMLKHFGINA